MGYDCKKCTGSKPCGDSKCSKVCDDSKCGNLKCSDVLAKIVCCCCTCFWALAAVVTVTTLLILGNDFGRVEPEPDIGPLEIFKMFPKGL